MSAEGGMPLKTVKFVEREGILCDTGDRTHVRINHVLRSMIQKMDKILFRPHWTPSNDTPLVEYIGLKERHISHFKHESIGFNEMSDIEKVRRGSFILHREKESDPQYTLMQCISNMNTETKSVVVITREKKINQTIEIDSENCEILNIKPDNDTLFWNDEPTTDKILEWRESAIKPDSCMRITYNTNKNLVKCKRIINTLFPQRLDLHTYSLPSTQIECDYYDFRIDHITLSNINTKIFSSLAAIPGSIPRGFNYEPLIEYSDHSLRSRRGVDECPCTFLAMFQHEAVTQYRKTSMKRYFTNDFANSSNGMSWKVFCGRLDLFRGESEDDTSTTPSIAPSNGDSGISDVGSESEDVAPRTPSIEPSSMFSEYIDSETDIDIYSRASSLSDDDDEVYSAEAPVSRPPSAATSIESHTSTPAVYNDMLNPTIPIEEKLTSTKLLMFHGDHSRLFINIFIIFQHWARHDQHKGTRADTALWDPNPDDLGFDVFYPTEIPNSNLRPWMFTVTNTLRDWICDIIYWDSNREVRDLKNITQMSIDMLKLKIKMTLWALNTMFNTKENAREHDKFEIQLAKERQMINHAGWVKNIDPIFAGRDWVRDDHELLVDRAKEIIKRASEKAFPIMTHGKIEPLLGVDIASPEAIADYAEINLKNMLARQRSDVQNMKTTLVDVSVSALVGTFIKKDNPSYDIIAGRTHIPILFPTLLQIGDILAIYGKDGCTIVKFFSFNTFRNTMTHENMTAIVDDPRMSKRNAKFGKPFSMKHRHICYELNDGSDPEFNVLEDFTKAFLLHKQEVSA